jgi:hypothetical protein
MMSIDKMVNELERMWKEGIVAQFNELSQILSGGI